MCGEATDSRPREQEDEESRDGTEMLDPREGDLPDDATVIDLAADEESQRWMDAGRKEGSSRTSADYSEDELDEKIAGAREKIRRVKERERDHEPVEAQD